jgi:hypothetical protein
MAEFEDETEGMEIPKSAKDLRRRLIYIKERLTEIKTERESLREEIRSIKAAKG